MRKYQNKLVFGAMYDGKNYGWNYYIPKMPKKNYLLDMKPCLLDGIKLIDDVLQIDDNIHGAVEKDPSILDMLKTAHKIFKRQNDYVMFV